MRLTRIDDAEPVVHHCPRQQRPEARTDKSPLRRALPRHGPKSATRPLFSMAILGCRYPRTESFAYRVAATCPITFKQLTRLNRDNAATTTTTTGSSSAEPIGRPNIAAGEARDAAATAGSLLLLLLLLLQLVRHLNRLSRHSRPHINSGVTNGYGGWDRQRPQVCVCMCVCMCVCTRQFA